MRGVGGRCALLSGFIRSRTFIPSASQITLGEHPAKHLIRAWPFSPSVIDKLGLLSAWAGHRAIQPLPICFGESSFERTTSIGLLDETNWFVIFRNQLSYVLTGSAEPGHKESAAPVVTPGAALSAAVPLLAAVCGFIARSADRFGLLQ
jgi:hypothetical protein